MMRYPLTAAAVVALAAGGVHSSAEAAGLDRSNQNISAIFSDSSKVDFSFGIVNPSVTGSDALGNSYDVGNTYGAPAFNAVQKIGDSFTFGLFFDQPYGASTTYGNSPLTSTLGGTAADLGSNALSFVGRYQITDRISVYGGLRAQTIDATVALNGTAYRAAISAAGVVRTFNAGLPATAPALETSTLAAALGGDAAAAATIDGTYGAGTTAALGASVTSTSTTFASTGGYNFAMAPSYSFGYLVGAAYEIPAIALRASATYYSAISHTSDTTEMLLGSTVASTVTFDSPQAVNIDFQTGIAADTLLMASYRWSNYSQTDVVPTALGSDLVNLDNGQRYTLGVGRRFSDNVSGSVTISYEPEGDFLVSPLGPTNGLWGISIGGRYEKDNFTFSGGVNYSMLGDAGADVGGTAVATFTDNSSLAVGFKMDWTF